MVKTQVRGETGRQGRGHEQIERKESTKRDILCGLGEETQEILRAHGSLLQKHEKVRQGPDRLYIRTGWGCRGYMPVADIKLGLQEDEEKGTRRR
jgi:hypothetical protein